MSFLNFSQAATKKVGFIKKVSNSNLSESSLTIPNMKSKVIDRRPTMSKQDVVKTEATPSSIRFLSQPQANEKRQKMMKSKTSNINTFKPNRLKIIRRSSKTMLSRDISQHDFSTAVEPHLNN